MIEMHGTGVKMSSGTFLNLNWLQDVPQIFQGATKTPCRARKTTHEWNCKQTKLKIAFFFFSNAVALCFVNAQLKEH